MIGEWFLAGLRRDRAVVLASLALVIILAWAYLLAGAGVEMETMDMGGGQTMAMPPEWTPAYGLVVFLMWTVMMVAMMLPSAAPMVATYALVAEGRGSSPRLRVWLFAGGSHNSLAVEFNDFITVIESPLDEARSNAVIAEVRKSIPNKPIIAGAETGDEASLLEPSNLPSKGAQSASLGYLALGSVGLSAWRREDEVTE